MKALQFSETGAAGTVLHLADLPVPEPGACEVLVKLAASPIHPADFLFMEGRYRLQPSFPQTAGLEGAGRVVRSGRDAALAPGTLVAFRTKNVWAEYVVVNENQLFVLPDDFPLHKAAQFALNPLTAYALLRESRTAPGDWLLLTAGNSALAGLLIQMARTNNVRMVATTRSDDGANALLALGVDLVVNTETENLAERVHQATGGRGVQAALDAVGGPLGTEVIKAAGGGATILLYGLLDAGPAQYFNSDVVLKLLTIKGFGLDHWLQAQPAGARAELVAALIALLAPQSFEMPVAAVYALDQYQQAIAHSKSAGGKVLLQPA